MSSVVVDDEVKELANKVLKLVFERLGSCEVGSGEQWVFDLVARSGQAVCPETKEVSRFLKKLKRKNRSPLVTKDVGVFDFYPNIDKKEIVYLDSWRISRTGSGYGHIIKYESGSGLVRLISDRDVSGKMVPYCENGRNTQFSSEEYFGDNCCPVCKDLILKMYALIDDWSVIDCFNCILRYNSEHMFRDEIAKDLGKYRDYCRLIFKNRFRLNEGELNKVPRREVDKYEVVVNALAMARREFADLNGRVSYEVWTSLFDTVNAIDGALSLVGETSRRC